MSILDNIEDQMIEGDILLNPLSYYEVSSIFVDIDFLTFMDKYIDKQKLLLCTHKLDHIDHWKDTIYVTQLSHGDHSHIVDLLINERSELFIRIAYWVINKVLLEGCSNANFDISDICSHPEYRYAALFNTIGINNFESVYEIHLCVKTENLFGKLMIRYNK